VKRVRLHLALLATAVAAAYWPAFTAGFMYDDRFFVQENPSIRQWSSVPSYFTAPVVSQASVRWHGIWRPLRSLSFLADYKLWGLNPAAFHGVNVALHLANVFLLYCLVLLLSGNAAAALAAALLFALHPVQTEAVAWVSSRGDLQAALFSLGSLLLFLKASGPRRGWAAGGSLVCLALALLSKESAIVLPALAMLTGWLSRRKGSEALVGNRILIGGFWILAGSYFLIRRWVLGAAGQCPYWGESFWTTAVTMIRVAGDYVRLLVWPWPLHVDYVYHLSTTLLDWRVIGCAALLAALTALALRDARRTRIFAWAWGWFVIALLPVSNLIPITTLLAERFLYLPLIGLAGWAGLRWGECHRPRLARLLLIAVLPGFAGLTFIRNLEWREPFTFWRAEAARSPGSFIAQGYLGGLHEQAGNADSALFHYTRAASVEPADPIAQAGLSRVNTMLGRHGQARTALDRWLTLSPNDADAWITDGIARSGAGDLAGSEASFRRAAALAPESPNAWRNLGLGLRDQQRHREAADAFTRAAGVGGDAGAAMQSLIQAALSWEQADRIRAASAWRDALRFAAAHRLEVNRGFIETRIRRLEAGGVK